MTDILILGGTATARNIAEKLAIKHKVYYALAGITPAPTVPANCHLITGGFGGAEGLRQFLQATHITHLLDITHPFAKRISCHAVAATEDINVTLLRWQWPRWNLQKNWLEATHYHEAARLAKRFRRPFLTIGHKNLSVFTDTLADKPCLVRSIVSPQNLPACWQHIQAQPPFRLDQEKTLLTQHQIDVLICKNIDTPTTKAKILAAQDLDLPVMMIAPPQLPNAQQVKTLEEIKKIFCY